MQKSSKATVNHTSAHRKLHALKNPEKAKFLMGFFKTGPGQYGEGDRFLGITVPQVRQVAKEFYEIDLPGVSKLLASPFNEERLMGLVILVHQYEKAGSATEQERLCDFYLKHVDRINNWNLVDLSAADILGVHLLERERKILFKMVKSENLWERRVAVVATLSMIRQNLFSPTLKLTELLLEDPEDLMHKACGWMLREVGKRDVSTLEGFLKKNLKKMPRTMLRYAIERFPEKKRKAYLHGTIL